ncbi:MAG: aldehyde ferredoxin oxidoreductase N-terminal domain-containing protein, partial [Chloroflexota bacterium]
MPPLGSLLRVDLAQGRVRSQAISKRLRRQFLGGEGINDWLLWEHFLKVSPRIDPVSPDNPLILGVGPLGATGLGAGCKMKWTFKGPAYGIFGDSVSGGNFGSHLRWAGFDHVVLTGKAPQPVYLWIDDDKVEIRDARHLWGKDAEEADRLIRQELGDKEIETAVIGRAGENLVRFASITVSRYRAAGRAGGGCVMGSKNLKGIAVRGSKGIQPADPKGFMEMIADLHERLNRNVRARDGYRLFGTLLATGFYQRIGANAYRNNQHSLLPEEKYQKLSHRAYNTRMEDGALSCSAGCVSPCGGWHRVKGDESAAAHDHAGSLGSKPEYLGIASFGVVCDIPDMAAVT